MNEKFLLRKPEPEPNPSNRVRYTGYTHNEGRTVGSRLAGKE